MRLPSPAARMTAVTWPIGYAYSTPDPRVTIRVSPKAGPRRPLYGVSKMRQQPLDPFRNRRGAFDHFPESRMHEGERRRVQRVTVERNRWAWAEPTVHLVADDRVGQRRQMYPDLVGAPGLQANLEQGEVGEALEHPIAGDRPLAAAHRADRHPHPVARMASDRSVHDRFVRTDAPVNHRQVAARHGPGGQLLHQIVIGHARLGDDEKARGVLVEPVDDARAARPSDTRGGRRVGKN